MIPITAVVELLSWLGQQFGLGDKLLTTACQRCPELRTDVLPAVGDEVRDASNAARKRVT